MTQPAPIPPSPPGPWDDGTAVEIRGPGRRWGVVHIAPAPGVCSVDPELGCGYCIGVPCRRPATESTKETNR